MKAAPLNPLPVAKQITNLLVWPILLFSQLIVALLISWHLLAQFDFAYPAAYDALDIQAHIERFGPRNHHRPGFGGTTTEQHVALFHQITLAIQDSGNGLEAIQYQTSNGESYSLLRHAEAVHLQDVANLIDFFYLCGGIALALMCSALALVYYLKLPQPPFKLIVIGIMVIVSISALVLLLLGAEDVFYWLHEQIFPPEHQWFFYYQDSLMTTLMKAPDLFGFIGLIWISMGLACWLLTVRLQAHLLAKRL